MSDPKFDLSDFTNSKIDLPPSFNEHVASVIERKNAENAANYKQQKFQNTTTIIALALSSTSILISIAALIISIVC